MHQHIHLHHKDKKVLRCEWSSFLYHCSPYNYSTWFGKLAFWYTYCQNMQPTLDHNLQNTWIDELQLRNLSSKHTDIIANKIEAVVWSQTWHRFSSIRDQFCTARQDQKSSQLDSFCSYNHTLVQYCSAYCLCDHCDISILKSIENTRVWCCSILA